MLFLTVFTLSLAALLFFYSLSFWLLVVLSILAIVFIVLKPDYKKIASLTLACLLPLVSVWWYLGSLSGGKAATNYRGEITIIQQYGPQKYLVRDTSQSVFFLTSRQQLLPGEIYRTAARVQSYTVPRLTRDWPVVDHSTRHYVFDYDKRLMMKGISGTLFAHSLIRQDSQKPDIRQKTRMAFAYSIHSMTDNTVYQSLLLGMTIGDKSTMPRYLYDEFIQSGLVHLIAVSGGNIAIVLCVLSALLWRVPFYVRIILLLCGIIAFTLLCGADSSIVRAAIMGSLGLVALLWGRMVSIWRLMGLSRFFMLLYNPFFLFYDLGFLLSFAALIGIVLMDTYYTRLSTKNKPTKTTMTNISKNSGKLLVITILVDNVDKLWTLFVRYYVIPTIGATLGVLPLLLFFTGTYNMTSVLGNILVVPLVPVIMIGGVVLTLLQHVPWLALTGLFSRSLSLFMSGLSMIVFASEQIIAYGLVLEVSSYYYQVVIVIVGLILLYYNIRKITAIKVPPTQTHVSLQKEDSVR